MNEGDRTKETWFCHLCSRHFSTQEAYDGHYDEYHIDPDTWEGIE